MTRVGPAYAISCLLVVLIAGVAARKGAPEHPRQRPAEVGNEACRPCHAAIVESYSRTAMARTSGPARDGFIEGQYEHPASGVSYAVVRDGDAVVLSYDRASPPLRGSQRLTHYIGSKTRGRAFLFQADGFLYQIPINYYSGKGGWEMAPGYAHAREMPLTRPVDATCLFCHASRVQPVAAGTLNRFAGVPFLQNGVGCERCHGPGSGHVQGAGPMVNPARLTGERRDSICVQCHLEGEARIHRAGRSQAEYEPGERLSEYLAIFVRGDNAHHPRGAVSHVESLAVSRCRIESGDRLSCITCHDPHVQPDASERAAYYRAKCLACHAPMAQRHHPDQQDCTACHMPRLESADIAHTAVTDHRIPRKPASGRAGGATGTLVQFGNPRPAARDLGLAYGEVALRGDAFAAREAVRLLEEAQRQQPDDPAVLTRLGYLYQTRGDFASAENLYERARKTDPGQAVASANLGVFYARRGLLREAIDIWRTTFDGHPQLSEVGVNLGRALCDVGDADGARAVLQRVLRHNPDLGLARSALAEIARAGC